MFSVGPTPCSMTNLKTFGISSGRLITESVTPAMKYQLCFGSCGCPRIEASSDGVIIAGRWFSGGMFKEVFVSRKIDYVDDAGLGIFRAPLMWGNLRPSLILVHRRQPDQKYYSCSSRCQEVCHRIHASAKCAKVMHSPSNTSLPFTTTRLDFKEHANSKYITPPKCWNIWPTNSPKPYALESYISVQLKGSS